MAIDRACPHGHHACRICAAVNNRALPPLRDLPIGSYRRFIRDAFPIEKLPDGALPIYTTEPKAGQIYVYMGAGHWEWQDPPHER